MVPTYSFLVPQLQQFYKPSQDLILLICFLLINLCLLMVFLLKLKFPYQSFYLLPSKQSSFLCLPLPRFTLFCSGACLIKSRRWSIRLSLVRIRAPPADAVGSARLPWSVSRRIHDCRHRRACGLPVSLPSPTPLTLLSS